MVTRNSYYVPDGKVRLLSPQHWAQQHDKCNRRGSADETTTGMHTTLFWDDMKLTRMVPILRDDNNIATCHPTRGHDKSNDEELDNQWEVTQQVPDPLDEPQLFNLDEPSALNVPSDLPNIIRNEEDTITDNPQQNY